MITNTKIEDLKAQIAELEKQLIECQQQEKQRLEKLQSIEVAPKILEKRCTWDDALHYCFVLGNGWRMPTKDEVELICESENDLILGNVYWTRDESTETDPITYGPKQQAYAKTLSILHAPCEYHSKIALCSVRPIRDTCNIKSSTLSFYIADVKPTEESMTWEQADKYCKSLGDGWRLPTLSELNTIRATKHDFSPVWYWTSNTRKHNSKDTAYAYGFNMVDGKCIEYLKRGVCLRVRAVYDNQ